MIFRRKHFALQTGYSFPFDLQYGFTLALFSRRRINNVGSPYRLIIETGWDWKPTITYYDPNWLVNEAGMLQGLPILRKKALRHRWIRSIRWDRAGRWEWLANDN